MYPCPGQFKQEFLKSYQLEKNVFFYKSTKYHLHDTPGRRGGELQSEAQRATSHTQNVKGADLQEVFPHTPPLDTQATFTPWSKSIGVV